MTDNANAQALLAKLRAEDIAATDARQNALMADRRAASLERAGQARQVGSGQDSIGDITSSGIYDAYSTTLGQ